LEHGLDVVADQIVQQLLPSHRWHQLENPIFQIWMYVAFTGSIVQFSSCSCKYGLAKWPTTGMTDCSPVSILAFYVFLVEVSKVCKLLQHPNTISPAAGNVCNDNAGDYNSWHGGGSPATDG
jgi:hypothetical protein